MAKKIVIIVAIAKFMTKKYLFVFSDELGVGETGAFVGVLVIVGAFVVGEIVGVIVVGTADGLLVLVGESVGELVGATDGFFVGDFVG